MSYIKDIWEELEQIKTQTIPGGLKPVDFEIELLKCLLDLRQKIDTIEDRLIKIEEFLVI